MLFFDSHSGLFALILSYFCNYFTLLLPLFSFSFPFPLFSFPFLPFSFTVSPFFSSPFHIFPPNDIGWYFFLPHRPLPEEVVLLTGAPYTVSATGVHNLHREWNGGWATPNKDEWPSQGEAHEHIRRGVGGDVPQVHWSRMIVCSRGMLDVEILQRAVHSVEVNLGHRSEVILSSTPKCEVHPHMQSQQRQ